MDKRRTNMKWTVLGLLLGLFMAALDQTIVSTAMPTIIGEFSGFDKLVWVFSAYMIATVVATPIFGNLSDMYGRKRFFILGLGLFLLGSILCGAAQSMNELIAFRALQGIGGGAIMPLCFAIIFDIFKPEQRGKMNGLFGAVFGLSSVLGPLAGAFFTDHINWRWIFYINAPLGLVALSLIIAFYKESGAKVKQVIDWSGVGLLTATILSLMFGLELGGKTYAWNSWPIIGLFAAFLVLFVLFVLNERVVRNPIVPLHLFKSRLFTASQLSSFIYGFIMISCASYIPIFIQGVYGGTASSAGQTLTPMMLGIVASSMVGGRFVGRFVFRNIMLVSVFILVIALLLLGTITADTARWIVTVYMIFVGLGIGVSYVVFNISALHGLSPQFKGTAVSLISFFSTIGSALGVTVFSVIQTRRLSSNIAQVITDPQQSQAFGDPQALLQPEVRKLFPSDVLHQMVNGLADSIAFVFQWSVILPVIAFLLVLLMGKANIEKSDQVEQAHG
jgi:EmrB/QacA subfamily drug resistance transporter